MRADDGSLIDRDDVIIVDDDLNIVARTKIGNPSSFNRDENDLQQQKTALVDEIQRMSRETNMKREVVLKLMGLLRAIDPLFLETKEKLEIGRKKLMGLKKAIKDDELLRQMFIEMGFEGSTFMDLGSKIVKDTQKDLANNLKTRNLDFARDVQHRSQGYGTIVSRYRDELREKIFAERDLFKKARMGKNDKL